MDYPESGHCVIFVACKSIRCYFSVFSIFSNVFAISSNLFWQHIMNFDTVHFGCSGFFTKAIRNLLNAVEFVFEFPSFCLCRSSLSCTSIIQCCASIFQWLSLMPRKFLGSRLHRSVAI